MSGEVWPALVAVACVFIQTRGLSLRKLNHLRE
jgi:hypothetical protein